MSEKSIFLSGRFASTSSAFRFSPDNLSAGCLRIEPPFMRTRGTRRNDTDHLAIGFFAICVNDNQNNQVLHRSDGMPALFGMDDALDEGHAKLIVKNQPRRFKVNAMLLFVGSVLSIIPLKL